MLKKRRFIQWALAVFVLTVAILCAMGDTQTASAETIVTDVQSLTDAIGSSETMIVVANDITLPTGYQITRDLTIKSSGGATLTWGSAARSNMFLVRNKAEFTLEDITLDGNGVYTTLVRVNDATFTMHDGAVLKNVSSDSASRAVTIGDTSNPNVGGTFNMMGGLITGVKPDVSVSCYNGTVNMSGNASISENNACGLAIKASTLTMTENATISNNTVGGSRVGAGLLAIEGSIVNMGTQDGDAPRISGNTATDYYCGGVYLENSELHMGFDASISDNNADTQAAGVGMNTSALTMSGNARISGNTTRLGSGGGVFASNSTVHLSENASVFGNSVTEDDDGRGGGIYLQNDLSVLTMEGSSSVNGNSSANGAGIYLNTGTELDMRGGSVNANAAGKDGGGIYLTSGGNAAISGASSIINNTALNGYGGGIYSENTTDYSNLTTSDETIFAGNMASVAYTPPENALVLYPNIQFASPSIGDHPLNNYDINFTGTDVLLFHVTYESNGGKGQYAGPDITPSYTDTILPLESTGITRIGYNFTGWNTAPDGSGQSYAPGDTVTLNRDLTLYAQWTAVEPAWQLWQWWIVLLVLPLILIYLFDMRQSHWCDVDYRKK